MDEPGVASPRDRFLAFFMLVCGTGLIGLYWALFFTTDLTLPDFVKAARASCAAVSYLSFERSFPAADGFVALSLGASGVLLLRRRSLAILFGLAGGGGLMFLALIDTLYNLENGLYGLGLRTGDLGLAAEALINLACFGGAVFILRTLWAHPLRKS